MTPGLVSIVLPTWNGAATLPGVLDGIRRQAVPFPIEVVAVDSGSTDGTLTLLERRADVVIRTRPEQFDHGLTRNLGVERSQGELVVLLVQDAEPVGDDWLAKLVAPLLTDDAVAGTFARQLPRPTASPLTRLYLSRWIGASPDSRSATLRRSELDALTPAELLDRCTFDNVCSCIRRSVWLRHPFTAAPIGEDLAWAREVLLDGHRLVYAADAQVLHSHDRSARYELARTYVLHRRLHELFGLRTIPSLRSLAHAIASSAALHVRCDRSARSIALAVAWPLGQYLGALSAVNGWRTDRIAGV